MQIIPLSNLFLEKIWRVLKWTCQNSPVVWKEKKLFWKKKKLVIKFRKAEKDGLWSQIQVAIRQRVLCTEEFKVHYI